jgi:hypothetical protein
VTKQTGADSDSRRQAGAEITPAMIKAGVSALYAANDDLLGWSSVGTVEHIAVVAYEAMENARLIEGWT